MPRFLSHTDILAWANLTGRSPGELDLQAFAQIDAKYWRVYYAQPEQANAPSLIASLKTSKEIYDRERGINTVSVKPRKKD